MFKKILSIILAALMMFSLSVCVSAEEATEMNEERLAILQGLGILPEDVKVSGTVSRGDFATWFAGIYTDDVDSYEMGASGFLDTTGKYAQPVAIIAAHGLIDTSVDTFGPRQPLLLEHGAKIAVTALGYGFLAELNGGYPMGYLQMAAEIGLMKGVNTQVGTAMRAADVVNLLYNTIATDVLQQETFGPMNQYDTREDETLLALHRDIYDVTGIITANRYTALSGAATLKDGYIEIDEVRYAVEDEAVHELLGHQVRAFYRDTDGQTEPVLFAVARENETLTLDYDSEITVDSSFDRITWLEGEKEKKADLSPVIKVIYNGEAYSDYTTDDFEIENGSVKLIDNDGDSEYDVAVITSYQTIVVANKTGSTRKVINRYTYSGALTELALDTDDNEKIRILKDGKEIEFVDIAKSSVLSAAISKSGEVVTVIVTNMVISGTLEELGSDGTVTVSGSAYELAAVYEEALAAKDSYAEELLLGQQYNLHLDSEGKIAYVTTGALSAMPYAYLTGIIEAPGISEEVTVKLFTQSGEWLTTTLKDKLTYKTNGETYNYTALQVFDELTETDGSCKRQMLKIQQNTEGEISYVETAVQGPTEEDIFSVIPAQPMMYTWRTVAFNDRYYIDSDMIVFFVPGEGVEDTEDNYRVGTYTSIPAEQNFQIQMYNLDEFEFTDLAVVEQTQAQMEASARSGSFFVVDQVTSALSEGETVGKIYGSMGDFKLLSLLTNDENLIAGVQRGDIIMPTITTAGRVTGIQTLYSPKNDGLPETPYGTIGDNVYVTSGYVTKLDTDGLRMQVTAADTVKNFRLPADVAVTIVDLSRESGLIYGTVNDIEEDDFVYLRAFYHNPADIVIIRTRQN